MITKIEKECPICKKIFKLPPYFKNKTCSLSCGQKLFHLTIENNKIKKNKTKSENSKESLESHMRTIFGIEHADVMI